MSKHERNGWRDEAISRRHRQWGVHAPCVDLDALVVAEYDSSIPVAIVEYKHENAKPILPADPNRKALANLAARANLPLFGVRYSSDLCHYVVTASGSRARDLLVGPRREFDEVGYIGFLYRLRGRTVPRSAR